MDNILLFIIIMYRYFFIFGFLLALITTNKVFSQKDTLIYYWTDWKSKELDDNRKLAGTIVIFDYKIARTYILDFGYIDWNIDKYNINEYYLSRNEGDKCFIKVFDNYIFMKYTFVYDSITLTDNITLKYRTLRTK